MKIVRRCVTVALLVLTAAACTSGAAKDQARPSALADPGRWAGDTAIVIARHIPGCSDLHARPSLTGDKGATAATCVLHGHVVTVYAAGNNLDTGDVVGTGGVLTNGHTVGPRASGAAADTETIFGFGWGARADAADAAFVAHALGGTVIK